MITRETLDAAYETSKRLKVSPELGVKPGHLASWIEDHLPEMAEAHHASGLHIAVELAGIAILAARADEHRN